MKRPSLCFAAVIVLTSGMAFRPALAAESYDNCTGFIDSVPTTINTQGVWCLRKDLSTAITSGHAITMATNNITLDCNGFKLGGLAAGNSSTTNGVYANSLQNATIRNCGIRGFYHGVYVISGAGHLVEDNRLDNNLYAGVYLISVSNSSVRRNRIFDTGGYPNNNNRYGIALFAIDASEVVDNTVLGVAGTSAYFNNAIGIHWGNYGGGISSGRVAGNVVSSLAPSGAGTTAYGIQIGNYGGTDGGRVVISANQLSLPTSVASSRGVSCPWNNQASVRDNIAWGFAAAFPAYCMDAGGNVSY